MNKVLAALALAALAAAGAPAQDSAPEQPRRIGAGDRLLPTTHPPLPAQPSQYWYVADSAIARTTSGRTEDAAARLAQGAKLIANGDYARALPLVSSSDLTASPLAQYGRYYAAEAQSGLSRLEEADQTLAALLKDQPPGALREAVTLSLAEVAIKRGDAGRAENLLEDLSKRKIHRAEDIFLALGRAEEAAGHTEHALQAYRRVYYEFPLSMQAVDAQDGIERLETPALVPADRFRKELARAEELFTAKRWAQARAAFEPLERAAQGDERELIGLRLAECAYYLDRFREARTALQPFLENSKRQAEARFFYLTTVRALGDQDTYVSLARQLVTDFPDSDWAAETLNNLASHYIIIDQDPDADAVFREFLQRFPKHRYAERAAWKTGWWAYRKGNFAETAELFENAAATFPRSDYRPSWLYWSARAHDQLGHADVANARYRLTVTDYQNSYYGRLATRILEERREPPVAPSTTITAAAAQQDGVPTDDLIRALTAAGLYDDALREVQYAQKVYGNSPRLEATYAWIRHRQGLTLSGTDRFNALRGAINSMRRAYPQFLAAGGEQLPADVLRVIFPLDFWPLITKYSAQHDLDPYVLTALMAQESTFTPEIRSAANAYGLLQLTPPTGRALARKMGIRRFSTSLLTQPEPNVRMGTQNFKNLIEEFGGVHYALAGYNAGPHRVKAWLEEAPNLPQDEFIDNIPYEETRAYVKRILGTAEDYRRLYGSGLLDVNESLTAEASGQPKKPAASAAKAKPKAKPAAKPKATKRTQPKARKR